MQLVRQFHLSSMCNDKGKALREAAKRMTCVADTNGLNNQANKELPCSGSDFILRKHNGAKQQSNILTSQTDIGASQDNIVASQTDIVASQVDMVATQWAFCGLAIIRCQELGIAKSSLPLLEDFMHFWRTIGHLMGIEDE